MKCWQTKQSLVNTMTVKKTIDIAVLQIKIKWNAKRDVYCTCIAKTRDMHNPPSLKRASNFGWLSNTFLVQDHSAVILHIRKINYNLLIYQWYCFYKQILSQCHICLTGSDPKRLLWSIMDWDLKEHCLLLRHSLYVPWPSY